MPDFVALPYDEWLSDIEREENETWVINTTNKLLKR
jgi:hypothetical protein